jgi:hypothetical protein
VRLHVGGRERVIRAVGHDDLVLPGGIEHDHGGAAGRVRPPRDAAGTYAGFQKVRHHLVTKAVLAHRADDRGGRAEAREGTRLVRALATGRAAEVAPVDRLARCGETIGLNEEVHVETADHGDHGAFVTEPPSSGQRNAGGLGVAALPSAPPPRRKRA